VHLDCRVAHFRAGVAREMLHRDTYISDEQRDVEEMLHRGMQNAIYLFIHIIDPRHREVSYTEGH
jgi:hypothetical protein